MCNTEKRRALKDMDNSVVNAGREVEVEEGMEGENADGKKGHLNPHPLLFPPPRGFLNRLKR